MRLIKNIQGLRALAVLMVVMVHTGLIEHKYSTPVLPDLVQFGMSGVDIFFVISGFIMMTLASSQKRSVDNAFSFLYARFLRIYPIYWFYSLLVLAVMLIHPSWVNSSSQVESDLLRSFLLLPQNGMPLLAVGWTLVHEIFFYIGFFILLLLFRSIRMIVTAVVFWGLLVVFANMIFSFSTPFLKLIFHPLTLEFIGGAVIAVVLEKISPQKGTVFWKIVAIVSVALLCVNFLLYFYLTGHDPMGWWRVLLFGIPSISLLSAAVMLEKLGSVVSDFWVQIGDRSYTIYLSHVLVINAVGKVWFLLGLKHWLFSWVFIVLLIVSTLLFGKYAYEWIERPLMKNLKRLKGRS